MRPILLYNTLVYSNFFAIYCIDILTQKTYLYYKYNEREVGHKNLISLIEDSYFVGYSNKKHNDILLNYIWDYKEINTSELYELSSAIITMHNTDRPLYLDDDIYYYTRIIISSFDLYNIIDMDDEWKINPQPILRGELRPIIEKMITDTSELLCVLNGLKNDNRIKYKMDGLCWK